MRLQETFLNGSLISRRVFWEDGIIKIFENYKENKLHGVYEEYDEEGVITLRGNYKNGLLHGTWTYYYHNGSIDLERHYKSGQRIDMQKCIED